MDGVWTWRQTSDTAPEVNHKFWQDFRDSSQGSEPECHYPGGTLRRRVAHWLQGDQWDTVMNYDAFMEPLTWFSDRVWRSTVMSERKTLEGDMRLF